jgi:hypothetical protein
MRTILIVLFFFYSFPFSYSQEYQPITGTLISNEYGYYYLLPTLTVEAEMSKQARKRYEKWTKLKYNVKRVYPYAIMASAKLKEYENVLKTLPNEKEKKKFMKKAENELQKQFSDELKSLTISQGRILIKLIDRETGNTSYELVKQLRGSFSAFMWQSLAVLFGSSLKSEYDSTGEDRLIEIAIQQIEAGQF